MIHNVQALARQLRVIDVCGRRRNPNLAFMGQKCSVGSIIVSGEEIKKDKNICLVD